MEKSTAPSGNNRTGMQTGGKHARQLIVEDAPPPERAEAIERIRAAYTAEAEPVGTIPPPKTAKGMAKSGMQKMSGAHPQMFADKLAERCAFERGGARLYEALLTKCRHRGSADIDGGENVVEEARLQEIRQQELQHLHMLIECIETLGADPTAETPSADLVGVETMGILQVVSDPRTTVPQALHAMLSAELADHAGWDHLCDMAEAMGQDEMADRFRTALEQEAEHVATVRAWYSQLTLGRRTTH